MTEPSGQRRPDGGATDPPVPRRLSPAILREYDIRGVVGGDLTTDDVAAIGRALAVLVDARGGRRITLGYDGRLSSPGFADALGAALAAGGLDVVDIGLGPTPMLYFAVGHLGTDAGVMVTGSHNPPEYNGIKMTWADGPIWGETIQELGRLAADPPADAPARAGDRQSAVVVADYVDRLLDGLDLGRPLSVAWDAGNGATGEVLRRITPRLPGRHVLLFDEIDGRFPNHHPDPTLPETLATLIRTVRTEHLDLGLAFDGDGDRLGVVDETGTIVWGDQLVALFAAEILQARPGAPIIGDVKSSQVLFDEVARLGGRPIMGRTGHSLMKVAMAETGAPLAGEVSGHLFFADKHPGYDDGVYAGLRVISLVSRAGESLAELRGRLPAMVNTPEIRFQVDEERKFAAMADIARRLADEGAEVDTTDGVRVRTGDGWWLLRASNTQDVLVARAESVSEEGLRRLKAAIAESLTAAGVAAPPF